MLAYDWANWTFARTINMMVSLWCMQDHHFFKGFFQITITTSLAAKCSRICIPWILEAMWHKHITPITSYLKCLHFPHAYGSVSLDGFCNGAHRVEGLLHGWVVVLHGGVALLHSRAAVDLVGRCVVVLTCYYLFSTCQQERDLISPLPLPLLPFFKNLT